jgi:glucose/arabinose dehydrogenase
MTSNLLAAACGLLLLLTALPACADGGNASDGNPGQVTTSPALGEPVARQRPVDTPADSDNGNADDPAPAPSDGQDDAPAVVVLPDIGTDKPLGEIVLPDGFAITMFAESVPGARSLALAPDGTVFVGSRENNGNVLALRDVDGDYYADERYVILSGGFMPNGVAFHDGDLYVGEVDKIWRYPDILASLEVPPQPELVREYPDDTWHGWKYIATGPDGMLYVPVGAPCNVCEREEPFATMTRLNTDGSGYEIYARGIRNTVGFDWDPLTGELWFTDNGRDMMGDNMPADELNHAPRAGMHFGFPYIHQGDTPDPDFGAGHDPADYTAPAQKLGPHVAALGMKFYTGSQFPEEYVNQIFIAEHGSWNRSDPIGARVMLVRLNDEREAVSYEVFAEGWQRGNESRWGRPVDILQLDDGSLLVSDDHGNSIFRIVYTGS